jgi:outer membrane protein TolC
VIAANQDPTLMRVFSTYTADTPQVFVDLDRTRTETLKVPVSRVFDTLQKNLGSGYVNDFNLYGRTYQVKVQAEARYRNAMDDVSRLYVRSNDNKMVPMKSLITLSTILAPQIVYRYNQFTSVQINGNASPGFSSGEAMAAMERLGSQKKEINMLPNKIKMIHLKKGKLMNPVVGHLTIRRWWIILALAVFIVPALAGCAAVGPDYTRVAPKAPEKWHAELKSGLSAGHLNSETLAHWWMTLNDPELTGLVERAVKGNLTLKDARSRLREARALRGISKAGLFPTIDAGASVTKTRSSENGVARTEDELYAAGFDASWELDIFGGVRRAVEAAQASLEATQADLQNVLVSLLAEVALNYIEVRTYQARLSAAVANIKTQQETYELNRSRYEAGVIDELAVQQALYNLERSRSQIPTLQIGLESVSSNDFLEWSSRAWTIGPNISWNIFDAGAIRQNIKVQTARQEQALIQYESAVLNAQEEVENILVAFAKEQRRRDLLARATEAARQADLLARDRYKAGLVDFNNVLSAQLSLLSFQDELVQSDGAVTTNLVRLYKALGGGWQFYEAAREKPVKTAEEKQSIK